MLRLAITEPGVQPKWTEKDKIPSQPKSKAALGHVPLPPDPCGVERVDRGDTAAAWIALCTLNLILIEPTGPELELCLDYKLWLTMVRTEEQTDPLSLLKVTEAVFICSHLSPTSAQKMEMEWDLHDNSLLKLCQKLQGGIQPFQKKKAKLDLGHNSTHPLSLVCV